MPLFWLSLAFMAGVLAAPWMPLEGISWLAIGGGCFLLGLLALLLQRRSRRSSHSAPEHTRYLLPIFLFSLCTFLLGAARYRDSQPDLTSPDQIAYYNDRDSEVWVTGIVSQPTQEREQHSLIRLQVESLQPIDAEAGKAIRGTMLVRLYRTNHIQYGDRLLVRGKLETPPEFEDFSYREYLAQQEVYSYMGQAAVHRLSTGGGNWLLRWIYAYKAHALEAVYRLWPDPEASLLAGILLGDESGIPDDVDQAFRDTGTSHIIVISGFNITIISALLVALFSRIFGGGEFGVRRAAIFALLGIALYTILVGGDAAVVRAAIMGGLALLATLLGRRQVGLNTLAVVAAAMATFNPLVLWNISFQLSFAATLGLVLYAEPLKEAFERIAARFVALERAQRWSPAVGEYLLFTLAAQVLVLPIIIYHFQRFSVSALLANPLILPVQPPLMMLGGLALLVGTIYYPLGQLLAWVAWPFVVYTIRVVELLARIPGGAVSLGQVSLLLVLIFYISLFSLTFFSDRYEKAKQWMRPGVLLTGLMLLAVLVWRTALAAPDGRLHMTLLDVGTGDGILIETPGGHSLLIDGGPSQRALSEALGRRLPLGRRELDWLIVAASGEEQIGGVAATLDRFVVHNVLWAGPRQGSYPARQLQSYLAQENITVKEAAAGQVLDLGDGANITILAVSQRGTVLMLSWENFRLLLPVGLDFELLPDLSGRPELVNLTGLLLAESGYAPVNPGEWIKALNPQLILLSVAAGDRQGLPSKDTLFAVEGYHLLRTDHNGWIQLITDGENLWVEVERD